MGWFRRTIRKVKEKVKKAVKIVRRIAKAPTKTAVKKAKPVAKKIISKVAPIAKKAITAVKKTGQVGKVTKKIVREKTGELAQKTVAKTQAFAQKAEEMAEKGISKVTEAISPALEEKRLAFKEQTLAKTDMVAGTVPIGGAAAGLVKGAIKGVSKGIARVKKAGGIINLAKQTGRVRSANRIAKIFGRNPKEVLEAMKYASYNNEILSAGKQWSGIKKALVGGALLGPPLAAWASLDNGLGGVSILTRDLADKVEWGIKDGTIDLEKATRIEAQAEKQLARREIFKTGLKYALTLSPGLWPFAKIFLAGADVADASIEENLLRIKQGKAQLEAQGQEAPPDYSELGISDETKETLDELGDLELTYAQNTALAIEMQARALKEKNREMERYWAKSRQLNEESAKRILEMKARYWAEAMEEQKKWFAEKNAYFKKLKEDAAPSQLNFGLL